MKNKFLTCTICISTLIGLSACSSIKDMFPDKEKDYQFTRDIPKLVVPNDLSTSVSFASSSAPKTENEAKEESADKSNEAQSEAETQTAETEKSAIDKAPEGSLPSEQAVIDPKSVTVELLQSSSNITYLRMNTPFLYTWRAVSKGLSRRAIEVSERNQTDKIFVVQYDPDEKPIEDGSYMDEINFMLHGLSANDKEYQLKLVESADHTDVVILNEEQKPISDEASLKLLGVLQKSIKANLTGK